MGEETITVGTIQGEGESGVENGDGGDVELPVVDLLTGRGFVTGKSGSGKSNSASVIAEKILDRGYSLLAVDIDGEYYGLKEEYEILHVGADEECDLRVGVEHAEKIAELALGGSVPIILDVSSFLDESDARELLTEVTKQLFAKGKKRKQPFLMLVEEVHEYIPEGGGIDECGRMLIKISKRGRKHGLGIVGISQRPADVKKDFITQCDWLVWHRLTWNNDTKVVSRILGGEYADEIEDMADGESFLMTDWNESIRRVQFERKRTFDAGATPGLDDFERPELKSVSGDLVDELQEITDEQERRANRVEELERELKQREERIRDLERQLADARDLKRMADRFSRAMMEQVTGRPLSAGVGRQSDLGEALDGPIERDPELEAELDAVRNGDREPQPSPVPDADAEWERSSESAAMDTVGSGGTDETKGDDRIADATEEALSDTDTPASEVVTDGFADRGNTEGAADGSGSEGTRDAEGTTAAAGNVEDSPEAEGSATDDPLISRVRDEIDALGDVAVEMLRQYREHGPMEPDDAHTAAGGSGDRGPAYATNRRLRQRGLVAHVGCGQYDYALGELVREELADPIQPEVPPDGDEVAAVLGAIESTLLPPDSASRSSEAGRSETERPATADAEPSPSSAS
ncbi:helicase HerA domain-containing protein [Natronomonas sp. LN261]|uniref:helicase HerA domain-containing protein n=1 Tax=Natronomonas sp. LN261 TaxID=2750669 RepID=UPI0015EE8953|nr:DUF87 domain-containing protein [Natronomonas sp. LN261]